MSLLDVLLARETHTISSRSPIDEVRRRLNEQMSPVGRAPRSPTPLVGTWLNADNARVSRADTPFGRNRRICSVRLAPAGSGTTVDATTRIDLFPVFVTLAVFAGFALFAYAKTSYDLSHGQNLIGSLFPFGYVALALLLLLVTLPATSAGQADALVALLEYIVGASPTARSPYPPAFPTADLSHHHVGSAETPQPPPPPPPADLPPPPVSVFIPPADIPPRRTFTDWLLARRTYTLVTAYAIGECERRVDPARVPTSPFVFARGDGGELILGNAAWQQRESICEMRVRFTRESFGTRIDAMTQVAPSFVKRWATWWFVFAALAAVSLLARLAGISLVPGGFGWFVYGFQLVPGPIVLCLVPFMYFNQRARGAGQARELEATLERVLAASPADRADGGVR